MFAAEQVSANPLDLEASLSVPRPYLWKVIMWKTSCYILQWRSIYICYLGAILSFLTLWLLGDVSVLFSGTECQLYANNLGWQFTRSKFSPHFCNIYCLWFKASHLIVLFLICNITLHFSSLSSACFLWLRWWSRQGCLGCRCLSRLL